MAKPNTDTQQPEPSAAPRRLLVALVALLVALALFAAAFVYVGGVDGVTSLLAGQFGASGPAVATRNPSASVGATDLAAAKLVYAEQIESQDNIDRLADGDIASFSVDSTQSDETSAIVQITVKFKDGTTAPGAMRFVRSGQLWYFTTISGLRLGATGGMADSVNSSQSIASTTTVDEKLASVGVEEPDAAVLKTIAQQQIVNQPLARDLIAGEYKWYTLGKPVAGPDTFTIPVKYGSSTESTLGASIIVIAKDIEGEDTLFITTFKRD